MTQDLNITTEYFRHYRRRLGFGTQAEARSFFGAKDLVPSIDYEYITVLNTRLYEIVDRINLTVAGEIKIDSPDDFKREFVDKIFEILRDNEILPTLNNQGRRPEEVYFSWMRGYVTANFFLRALGTIFEVDVGNIKLIGDDDLRNVETFRRTPKADLEIELTNGGKIRIEMQSGFTGINDIKQHKVLEAKRVYKQEVIHSLAIHFDLYNGQVAFVKLDEIEDEDVNWITRQQMEGQTVFNIEQNYFVWKLTKPPIKYRQLDFG